MASTSADVSAEAPMQRDANIAEFVKIYRPCGDGAAHILSVALTDYNHPEYVPSVCATLLKNYPQLYEPVVKAYYTTTYKPLVDAVLNLTSLEGLHSFRTSLANTGSLRPAPPYPVTSPVHEYRWLSALRQLPPAVREAIERILPSLQKVVEPDWTWPVWEPTNVSASESPEIHAWLSELKIPVLHGRPCLLLHRLGPGQLGDGQMFDRLRSIFNVHQATLFVNTVGSGKTRLLFEGLSQRWGFYFTANTRGDTLGSTDLMHCIEARILATPGFTHRLPETDFEALLDNNRSIASDCITQVFLARFIVFRAFLNAIIVSGRKITEDDKLRWLYLQLDPGLLDQDIFDTVAQVLNEEGVSGPMCEHWIQGFRIDLPALINSHFVEKEPSQPGTKAPESLQPEAGKNVLHVVIDDAQSAATLLSDAFRTAYDDRHSGMADGTAFTLSGTAIDRKSIEVFMGSCIMKFDDTVRASSTGSFDKADEMSLLYQQAYIRRYLPVSIQKTDIGRRLMQRITDWLAGRFYFTASFLADLLDSDFENPHQFLNDWIEFHTGFRPTDASDLTQPFCVTTTFPTKRLYTLIEFDKVQLVQGVAQFLTDLVYGSLVRSGITSSFDRYTHQLVEYGVARHTTADCTTACISEPLVLLATAYRVNKHCRGQTPFGQSIWQYVVRGIGERIDSKFDGFETYLAFLLADAFATPVPLKDVFEFASPAPEWANQSARLVALSKDPVQETREGEAPPPPAERRIHKFNWRERAISTGRIGETCDVEGTLQWLNHEHQAPFCFPDTNMGPDLICVLQLESNELIWVALEAKFLKDKIEDGPLKDAIRTTVPDKYFVRKSGDHYLRETRPRLVEDTREALMLAGGANTGTKYPLLRVVVISPPTVGIDQLDAHIDDRAALLSDAGNHHDPDGHPLVALNWKKLLATTANADQRFLRVFKNSVDRDPNTERTSGDEGKRKRSGEDEREKKRQRTAGSSASTTVCRGPRETLTSSTESDRSAPRPLRALSP
ncbi:hypothetical protein C8R47DRAFT_1072639 [Mycena vitilis]|nr:hypothetical protein C8R47DRAFT_1072639 [Mycena vitilis]